MGQWELKTYQCRCGCKKTWRALKEPKPEDQYALATHRPLGDRPFSFAWATTINAWALKIDDLFEGNYKHGETETVET